MSVYLHHAKDGTVSHLQCDDHSHTVFHSYDSEPREPREPREARDDATKREAALDAREAAMDFEEEERDEDDKSEEAKDRKRARDQRAIARDRRAPGDGKRARDADPDHRKDFDPLATGGPDSKSRAADAKRGMAQDRDARTLANADAIWPSSRPYRNDAPADVDANTIWN